MNAALDEVVSILKVMPNKQKKDSQLYKNLTLKIYN